MSVVSVIDVIDEPMIEISIEDIFVAETLAATIMNVEGTDEQEYEDMVKAFVGMGSYPYAPKKLDFDLKNHATPPARPSIEQPPILELKALICHRCMPFLELMIHC